MTNKEKYNKIFMECFDLEEKQLENDIEYNSIESWDSIGHMEMIAELEDTFDIEMETDDIINFSSYKVGFELLANYGIEI